ncbi:MAG TPA: hypothetical protein VFG25_01335 [Nitrosopumilaceae archaeon]|nr:hypothetical protein [Nitrosopumilaceae archaeon]
MPTLRRPSTPKIKTPRLLRNKNTSKSLKAKIGTKRPSLAGKKAIKKNRKKDVIKLGTCYKNTGCRGPVLLKRVSKARCKSANGKSWKGARGCQSIV